MIAKIYEYYIIGLIIGLAISAGLGLIPANIAKKKGYSFGLWWLYGWLIFIVALIHISLLPDKNASVQRNFNGGFSASYNKPTGQEVADELKKYKELFEQGVINEEEFKMKKEQLLRLM